jgi:hypothetical protein
MRVIFWARIIFFKKLSFFNLGEEMYCFISLSPISLPTSYWLLFYFHLTKSINIWIPISIIPVVVYSQFYI